MYRQSFGRSENCKIGARYSSEFDLNGEAGFDYQKEAQLITKLVADNEEAKTIQMLIDRGIFVSDEETDSFATEAKSESLNSSEFDLNGEAGFDYQKEAQLITKLVADNEEAKTIQMLIDKGIFVSNEEAASLAGETKSVNLNSSELVFNEDSKVDYQKEAS